MKYKVLAHPSLKEKAQELENIAKKYNWDYSLEFGTDDYTTRDIAARINPDEFGTVICLGGDGTLHGILNGLYGKELKLGIIPSGHGNDMARSLNIPKDINQAIDIIDKGNTDHFYLGKISKIKSDQKEYFFSVAGIGFDVKVIELVDKQKLKERFGKNAYNIGTFKALFSYQAPSINAIYDGKKLKVDVMMFSVGNSTTYGGGMKVTPKADPRTNLFNITYLKKMRIPTFMWHFPKVFSGKHIKVKKYVKNFDAKEITIDSEPRGKIIADGELLDLLPAKITKSKYKQEIIIT